MALTKNGCHPTCMGNDKIPPHTLRIIDFEPIAHMRTVIPIPTSVQKTISDADYLPSQHVRAHEGMFPTHVNDTLYFKL